MPVSIKFPIDDGDQLTEDDSDIPALVRCASVIDAKVCFQLCMRVCVYVCARKSQAINQHHSSHLFITM